jgi:hypothetical protein
MKNDEDIVKENKKNPKAISKLSQKKSDLKVFDFIEDEDEDNLLRSPEDSKRYSDRFDESLEQENFIYKEKKDDVNVPR